MVAKPTHLTEAEIAQLELEDRLYEEMMERHHQQWYAIVNGKLYRDAEYQKVREMLVEDGVNLRGLLIDFMPHGPPYRV